MPHQTQELPTLSDADLVTTTGGFDLSGLMGSIGGMVQQFGGEKAAAGFQKAQGIMSSIMPMIGQMSGGAVS